MALPMFYYLPVFLVTSKPWGNTPWNILIRTGFAIAIKQIHNYVLLLVVTALASIRNMMSSLFRWVFYSILPYLFSLLFWWISTQNFSFLEIIIFFSIRSMCKTIVIIISLSSCHRKHKWVSKLHMQNTLNSKNILFTFRCRICYFIATHFYQYHLEVTGERNNVNVG